MAPRPRALVAARSALAWHGASRRALHVSAVVQRQVVEDHDVVVVGGGPAGLALAAALASSPRTASSLKLTLVEASRLDNVRQWNPPPTQYSNRVSSITSDNVDFLREIGVWQEMDHTRTRDIEEMQVWDGISGARITFTSPTIEPDPFGETAVSAHDTVIAPMATLVENLNLQRASLRALAKRTPEHNDAVELIDGAKVLAIEPDDAGWPVVHVGSEPGAPNERQIRARLLIGADGANSPVKTYSKIDSFGWPYDAQGIVASLQVSEANGGQGMSTAWQRFLPEGPIAFLPLSNTTSSLVWSTTPQLAKAIKTLPLDLLSQLVNAAFSLPYDALAQFLERLKQATIPPAAELSALLSSLVAASAPAYDPNFIPDELPPPVADITPGTVASFPLRLSHVSSYIGLPRGGLDLRTALVGDAAHTVHPLAGQGLNMGLGDIRSLVETLDNVVQHGGDVGSYNSLRPYPRSRYIPNHAILSTCDHLASLYGTTSRPVVWARSTGLETVNEIDSLKRLLIGGAGGNARVKRPARGGRRGDGGSAGAGAGAWGLVGDGIDSLRGGVRLVKNVGQLVGMQLRDRLMQMGGNRR